MFTEKDYTFEVPGVYYGIQAVQLRGGSCLQSHVGPWAEALRKSLERRPMAGLSCWDSVFSPTIARSACCERQFRLKWISFFLRRRDSHL